MSNISKLDQKLIKGVSREIAATSDVIEENAGDHELLITLTEILYDHSERLVKILDRSMPPGENWLDTHYKKIKLKRQTTHRSEAR